MSAVLGTARRSTVIAALALLLRAMPAGAQEPAGSVAALEGNADDLHPGQAAPVALKPADTVLLGDRLHTASASKLRLVFRDDSVLTLAAESELAVTAQLVGPARASSTLSLWVGTVRALVTERYKAPGSSFELETPTAVAGVRGTAFIVDYDAVRKVTLVVSLFDVVCVRARGVAGPEVCLTPRRYTEVREGKLPSVAATIDERRLAALIAATDIPGGGIEPERELGPSAGLKPDERPPEAVLPATAGSVLSQPERARERAVSRDGQAVDQPVEELEKLLGQPKGVVSPPPTTPPPTTPPPTTPPPTTPPPTTPPATLPPKQPPPTQPPTGVPPRPGQRPARGPAGIGQGR